MEPPKEAKITESPSSIYWFDAEGILCATIKKDAPVLSLQERKAAFENFRDKMGDKKICMMVDITNAAPLTRETQNFNFSQYPRVFKAIAFISRSAYGRMLGHLYLGMHANPFPFKIFSSEEDARTWIRDYL